MAYDFNDAQPQSSFDLIPAGTVAPVAMKIRPGGVGDGGWMTQSKSSDAVMLDCEFSVTAGEYANRRFWQFFTLSGGKTNEKGESIGGNISRSSLRAILESARGIDPKDETQQARARRSVSGWHEFNGLVFLCRVGVQKDKTGQYADKNGIREIVTPGMKEYQGGGQQGPSTPPTPPPPPPVQPRANPAPAWAR